MRKVFIVTKILILFILILFIAPFKVFAEEITGDWFSTEALPYKLASHASYTSGSTFSIIGGSAQTGQSRYDVLSPSISVGGGIINWSTTSLTQEAVLFHKTVQYGELVYILGGKEENPGSSLNHVSKVYVGKQDQQGVVGEWTELIEMPQSRSLGGAVIVGDRIYYAGGFNNSGTHDDIYYANINPDGTLGSWTTSSISLPQPLSGFEMIAHGDNIIVFGGMTDSDVFSNKAYTTTVNPDGSLNNFSETSHLPEAVYRGGSYKIGSTIMSVGGYNGVNWLDKVYFTKVNPDGTLSSWQVSENTLPEPIGSGAVAYANGFLYYTGGFGETGYTNSVYYVKLNISENVDLSVPYYSQNDARWGSQEYDHAASLGFSDPDFERWGCAVTSAAMVLNYHGMDEFEDGSSINPGSLNSWLKENEGYLTGSGPWGSYSYLIWPSISRLTQELFDSGKSSIKLEHQQFKNKTLSSESVAKNDLSNGMPLILGVDNEQTNGHFVVAKGFDDNTLLLNDPEFNHQSLTAFGSQYYQVDKFVPSNTDLSYIVLVVNPGVEVLITDPEGNRSGKISNGSVFDEMGDNSSYGFQKPISNPDNEGNLQALGTGVNEFLLSKPALDGEYKITLTSGKSTLYTLNISVFQENGTQTSEKIMGSLSAGQKDEIILNFSKTSKSSIENIISFKSLIDDIITLAKLGEINKMLDKPLINKAETAEKIAGDSRKVKSAINLLESMEQDIKRERGRRITDYGYSLLFADIQNLTSQLNDDSDKKAENNKNNNGKANSAKHSFLR